jgi:hypothetical protein
MDVIELLSVFQPTLPIYYNNGVCQYKRGAASSYILGTIFSDCMIYFNFAD